jgi:exopolysaccharide production protein ExoY
MDSGSARLSLYRAVETSTASAEPSVSFAYRCAKRSLDVLLSTVALVVTLPVWLAVAVLVRATSPGPVFFRQRRVGREGRLFTVLKFRSMCSDAEARLNDPLLYNTYVATGYKLPVAEDFRVTRVGRFLRATSLDELPQLFNVLRGDMSMVGPRPVVPAELESYGELLHCYLSVRPGVTGAWQVSGRSLVRFPERAQLDDEYFRKRCMRVDLAILARTPRAVVRGHGAH